MQQKKFKLQRKVNTGGCISLRNTHTKCFTSQPLTSVKSIPTRLVNALIKALNDNNKLPHLMIFMPDWDIVNYVNYFQSGVKEIFNETINWILAQVMRAIQSKKDSLAHRKPGAVITSQPKVIWVKMMERIGGEFDRAFTARY